MTKVSGWTSLVSVLAVFAIVSCGILGPEDLYPDSIPDMTGLWYGTFSSGAYSTSIDINITLQSENVSVAGFGDVLSGEWKYSYSDTWSTSTEVTGWVQPAMEGGILAGFQIIRGPWVVCIAGQAYNAHTISFSRFGGYYENGSIVADDVYHNIACESFLGEMTLTKLYYP